MIICLIRDYVTVHITTSQIQWYPDFISCHLQTRLLFATVNRFQNERISWARPKCTRKMWFLYFFITKQVLQELIWIKYLKRIWSFTSLTASSTSCIFRVACRRRQSASSSLTAEMYFVCRLLVVISNGLIVKSKSWFIVEWRSASALLNLSRV